MAGSTILQLPSAATAADTCKFLEKHNVLVPAQLNEAGGHNVTYSVSLSGMCQGIKHYIYDSLIYDALGDVLSSLKITAEARQLESSEPPTAETVKTGNNLHFIFGIPKCCCCCPELRSIEDCDIEIREPRQLNIEDCDINII